MLLAADMGNTDIVFALHDGNKWIGTLRNPSSQLENMKEGLVSWLKDLTYISSDIKTSIFSSVVPAKIQEVETILTELLPKPPLILGPELYKEFPIHIEKPAEIGSDLVANAYGAYAQFQEACVIVDFGTALSFTMVSSQGEILGVAIAPGLKTSMGALFSKTAQLFEVPLTLPETVIGKNTAHALQSGILLGYVGLVKEILGRVEEELGEKPKIIATGGLVNVLTPLHGHFDKIDPMHTMEGLRLIAERFSS